MLCKICGRKFAKPGKLAKHIDRFHPTQHITTEPNEQPSQEGLLTPDLIVDTKTSQFHEDDEEASVNFVSEMLSEPVASISSCPEADGGSTIVLEEIQREMAFPPIISPLHSKTNSPIRTKVRRISSAPLMKQAKTQARNMARKLDLVFPKTVGRRSASIKKSISQRKQRLLNVDHLVLLATSEPSSSLNELLRDSIIPLGLSAEELRSTEELLSVAVETRNIFVKNLTEAVTNTITRSQLVGEIQRLVGSNRPTNEM
jgi:hypothetical protein